MIYESKLKTKSAIGGDKLTEMRLGGDIHQASITFRRTDDVGTTRVLFCETLEFAEMKRLAREMRFFCEAVEREEARTHDVC